MAHCLEIRNGEASMFYVGDAPWHGLGQELNRPATAAEAIRAARMDWDVAKVPLCMWQGERIHDVPGKFAVIRRDQWDKAECPVLGIVGKDYEPLQNKDAFAFFDPIVGKDAAIYQTAGVLGDGERVWILAKLPGDIRVVGDDIAEKYLLLSNSHDGESAVQIKFTPIRVVCQNTLTMALSKGPTVRVTHTRNLRERLRRAERLLGIVNTRFEGIKQAFQAMSGVRMNEERLAEYLGRVFPDPKDKEDKKAAKRVAANRSWSRCFFDQGRGNRMRGVAGTLWAAYNGVTEFVDHHQTKRQDDDRRLDSVWFGDGYLVKARAYQIAEDRLKAWAN